VPVATVGVTCVLVLVPVSYEGNRQPPCLVKLDLFPTRGRAHARCRSGLARADATGSTAPPTASDVARVGQVRPLPAGADRARDCQMLPPRRPHARHARGAPAPPHDTRSRTTAGHSAHPARPALPHTSRPATCTRLSPPRRRACRRPPAPAPPPAAAVTPAASGSPLRTQRGGPGAPHRPAAAAPTQRARRPRSEPTTVVKSTFAFPVSSRLEPYFSPKETEFLCQKHGDPPGQALRAHPMRGRCNRLFWRTETVPRFEHGACKPGHRRFPASLSFKKAGVHTSHAASPFLEYVRRCICLREDVLSALFLEKKPPGQSPREVCRCPDRPKTRKNRRTFVDGFGPGVPCAPPPNHPPSR